ncbi:MAG: DegT/DnrJ/EryC1/StrS family aminotransferase [Vicinamibacterales bacterium]
MITTRERIRISELLGGLMATAGTPVETLLQPYVPLHGRHVQFASQGKAAFEQIVVAAGLAGSRIIMPAFFPDDFVGVFQKYGITPVFADVDVETYHLDLGTVTPAHLDGARALLIEHTFGLPADGRRYREFCDAHGLLLIEDCARALGASRAGRLVGSDGHYAMFSLPKCLPVRAGGLALAATPLPPPAAAHLGVDGLLHAATLIKYPLSSMIEHAAYALLADSPVYPREVGNYAPLPVREFDAVGRLMLRAFLPRYGDALARKRECARVLREALEPLGFTFQADGGGDHICTSVSVDPPAGADADALKADLVGHGVKASAMWRNAIGVSAFGAATWRADAQSTPVSLRLAQRLVQLPVSRFRTAAQSERIIGLCRRHADASARLSTVCLAAGRH